MFLGQRKRFTKKQKPEKPYASDKLPVVAVVVSQYLCRRNSARNNNCYIYDSRRISAVTVGPPEERPVTEVVPTADRYVLFHLQLLA